MNVAEIIAFVAEHVGAYLSDFVAVLASPRPHFEPESYKRGRVLGGDSQQRFSSRLVIFATLNVIFGSAFLRLSFSGGSNYATTQLVLYALFFWFMIGIGIHLFSFVLRGRGEFLIAVSAVIQVLSTIYVVSAVATLIASSALPPLGIKAPSPRTIYLGVQAGMVLIYIPLSVGNVYQFGLLRKIILGVAAAVSVAALGFVLFNSIATMPMAPPHEDERGVVAIDISGSMTRYGLKSVWRDLRLEFQDLDSVVIFSDSAWAITSMEFDSLIAADRMPYHGGTNILGLLRFLENSHPGEELVLVSDFEFDTPPSGWTPPVFEQVTLYPVGVVQDHRAKISSERWVRGRTVVIRRAYNPRSQ